MSDEGRKDFTTSMFISAIPRAKRTSANISAEAKEEITPDSAKSTQDKVKEAATDTKDRVVRGVQPDENKSGVQEAFDKGQRVHDDKSHGGGGASV